MLSAIYANTAAAPLVSLSLAHIARTPTARLGISYQIVPDYVYLSDNPGAEAGIQPWYAVPLGAGLYLDSLLSGGIDGQPLILAVSGNVPAAPGATIDVLA
jgi:hypothetical protein